MNNKNTTNHEDIPEFINLEEYNNLLCELEHLDIEQLKLFGTTVKIQAPEVVMETMKLISVIFYRMPINNYLQHCIFSSMIADFDRLLRHHQSYEKLFELLKKLDNNVGE